MATDINADLHEEIESAIARVNTLSSEGNTEGAAELAGEVEGMISALKTGKGVVAKRKEYREALSEAQKAEPSREIEKRMPETIAEVDGLEELVKLGAQRVREVAEHKLKGGRALAEILLDIRRRIILPDGTPDLAARSYAAKQASSEIYGRVLADLPAEGESEMADDIRAEIKSIHKGVQNAMTDVRVAYVRSLDHSSADELAQYKNILDPDSDKPASEQIAEHYGIRLQTRAEIESERRAAKAELQAKREAGEELDPAEEAELAGEKYVAPADALRKIPAALEKVFGTVRPEEIDDTAFDQAERDKLRAKLTEQIAVLSSLIAAIS